MIWGAHEADVRLAALNARKIQAAMRLGLDAKRVYEMYLATHPAKSKNPTQDRARARAWAMLNLRINNEPLREVLQRVWADGYVLGQTAADDALRQAREARKAGVKNTVDWANWKPGDLATAELLRPSKAFQQLLGRAGISLKEFDSTTYERVGTALADAISVGMSSTSAAKLINQAVCNPARALTIAITEQNRAMSHGSIQRYKESAVDRIEWQTVKGNPCDQCLPNAGQVIEIGQVFNSGSEMPPEHPHCRCALLPVLPDFATNEHGVQDVAPPQKPLRPDLSIRPATSREIAEMGLRQQEAGFGRLSLSDAHQQALASYTGNGYKPMNAILRGNTYTLREDIRDRVDLYRPYVDDLKDLISSAPAVEKPMLAYRGMKSGEGSMGQAILDLPLGSKFEDKGFVSTSMYPDTPQDFMKGTEGKGLLMEIELPAGTKGYYYGGSEAELILSPNSKFEIVDKKDNVVRVRLINE